MAQDLLDIIVICGRPIMKSFKGGVPAPVCHCQIISQIIPLDNAIDIEAPLTDCIPLCSLLLTAINLLSNGQFTGRKLACSDVHRRGKVGLAPLGYIVKAPMSSFYILTGIPPIPPCTHIYLL